ncbi:MAG: SoxR reducing system RseC family protein [Alkalispirochaeta sp.]
MNHIPSQCKVVTQPGVVTALHGTEADIQIVQHSACSSCKIRGLCAPSESSTKTVRVPNHGDLMQGAQVEISMQERHGWLGVFFAFVAPLGVVVGALFTLAGPLGSEESAALVGLAALLPYYGVLYLTRHIFADIIRFDVHPASLHKEGVQ